MHFIKVAPPGAIMSVVGDSYNYPRFLRYMCNELKSAILARPGKFVARPDSGYPPDQAEYTMDALWNGFGGTVNANGYREINPKVGSIYGDWINYAMLRSILTRIATFDKYAIGTGNIIFGSGGGLLQQITRDTHKFAFKACQITTASQGTYPVFKRTGDKSSKTIGKMMVVLDSNGDHETIAYDENRLDENQLQVVYEAGFLIKDFSWEEVRANVQKAKDTYINSLL